MKKLKDLILEKLIINKNTDATTHHNEGKIDDKDTIYNIIIAAYLSIKRNKCWVEGPTFRKTIKYIKYDDILNILNENFNYDFDKKDIKVKTGYIWKIVKQYLVSIENLCNYYIVKVKINDEDIKIDYDDVDKQYKKILREKKV